MQRFDHKLISKIVSGKVIDLGCGEGELIERLDNCLGLDIDEEKVLICLEKGLSVIQSNIDEGLKNYSKNSFDYVVLCNSLQTVHYPIKVLREALRIGKKVVVTFPNFAHYKVRFGLFLTGRMPKSKDLPYEWYNTPNIHFFTIKDFEKLCLKNKFKIKKKVFYSDGKRRTFHPNFLAKNALYVVSL